MKRPPLEADAAANCNAALACPRFTRVNDRLTGLFC